MVSETVPEIGRYRNIPFQYTSRNGFRNGIHNIGCTNILRNFD